MQCLLCGVVPASCVRAGNSCFLGGRAQRRERDGRLLMPRTGELPPHTRARESRAGSKSKNSTINRNKHVHTHAQSSISINIISVWPSFQRPVARSIPCRRRQQFRVACRRPGRRANEYLPRRVMGRGQPTRNTEPSKRARTWGPIDVIPSPTTMLSSPAPSFAISSAAMT